MTSVFNESFPKKLPEKALTASLQQAFILHQESHIYHIALYLKA